MYELVMQMYAQPTKRKRTQETDTLIIPVASDSNFVEFSSDPSQKTYNNDKSHYKPRNRAKWLKEIVIVINDESIDDKADRGIRKRSESGYSNTSIIEWIVTTSETQVW